MKGYAVAALAAALFWGGPCAYGQAKVTRPEVSEEACPVEVIEAPTRDKHRATAAVRKPPGKGPFPAVVLLHAGMGGRNGRGARRVRRWIRCTARKARGSWPPAT